MASNTEYKELGYDGFEDYERTQSVEAAVNSVDHFSFKDAHALKGEGGITDVEAHTGRKSIEVKPSKSVSLVKKLDDVNPDKIDDCAPIKIPTKNPSIQRVSSNSVPICFGRKGNGKKFIINGVPGQKVKFQLAVILDQQSSKQITSAVRILSEGQSSTQILLEEHFNHSSSREYTFEFTMGNSGKAMAHFDICTPRCARRANFTVNGTFTLYDNNNVLNPGQSISNIAHCNRNN